MIETGWIDAMFIVSKCMASKNV